MGQYIYITQSQTKEMKTVLGNKRLNKLLQEALEYHDGLMIEETVIQVKAKWYSINRKTRDEATYTLYHEERAHNGDPYQAQYILSETGEYPEKIASYLCGIIDAGLKNKQSQELKK